MHQLSFLDCVLLTRHHEKLRGGVTWKRLNFYPLSHIWKENWVCFSHLYHQQDFCWASYKFQNACLTCSLFSPLASSSIQLFEKGKKSTIQKQQPLLWTYPTWWYPGAKKGDTISNSKAEDLKPEIYFQPCKCPTNLLPRDIFFSRTLPRCFTSFPIACSAHHLWGISVNDIPLPLCIPIQKLAKRAERRNLGTGSWKIWLPGLKSCSVWTSKEGQVKLCTCLLSSSSSHALSSNLPHSPPALISPWLLSKSVFTPVHYSLSHFEWAIQQLIPAEISKENFHPNLKVILFV